MFVSGAFLVTVGEEDLVVTCFQLPGGGEFGISSPFPSVLRARSSVCPGRLSAPPLLLCLFLGPEAKLVLCSHVTVARRGPLAAVPVIPSELWLPETPRPRPDRARSPFTGAPGSAEAAEGTWAGECSNSCFW